MRYDLKQIANSPFWYITWSERGRSKRHSTGTTSRAQAELYLAAFRLEHDPTKPRQYDLPAVFDYYFEAKKTGGRNDVTTKGTIDRLTKFFGLTDPCNIDFAAQAKFIKKRREEGKSDSTIKRDLSVLSAALNYAHKHRKIGPPHAIEEIAPAPPRERYLTRTEAAKLLWYMRGYIRQSKRYHHLLLFTRIALRTGQRSGVILSLTWDRVDFDIDNFHFQLPGHKQTNKRQITIGFNHYLRRALLAERKRQREEAKERGRKAPQTVISFEGRPVNVTRKAFVKACEAVGIMDTTPNTLRHTFGTWAARNSGKTNISLFDIGGAMAHSNVQTTQRYAKHMPGAHMSVVNSAGKR